MSKLLTVPEIQALPNLTQVEIAWAGEAVYAKYWIARRDGGQVWTLWRGRWMRHIPKTGTKLWDVRVRTIKNPKLLDPTWEPEGIDYTPRPLPKPKPKPKPPKKRKPKPKPPTKSKRKYIDRKLPTPGVLELLKTTDLSGCVFATSQSKPLPITRWHIWYGAQNSFCWVVLNLKGQKTEKTVTKKYICIGCLKKLNKKQQETK